MRNVTTVVLDVNPIITENCEYYDTAGRVDVSIIIISIALIDNISYYKCDVSKWEEVEAVSKVIVEEVSRGYSVVTNRS